MSPMRRSEGESAPPARSVEEGPLTPQRRRFVIGLVAAAASAPLVRRADAIASEARWYEAAVAMQQHAQSQGDQPYGAVLVLDGAIVGAGPSRVLQRGDPDGHAEREALRDAQQRLGRSLLAGSMLYSTSRPCRHCESAAAQAGVARMVHGAALTDAGSPAP